MSETKKQAQHVIYGALLVQKITEIISEEGSELNINRIANADDLNDFMHALATLMPSSIYTVLTGDKVDGLRFNHIANRLCFQYKKKETDEK